MAKKKKYQKIGAAWIKEGKNGEFISLTFSGKREQDDLEVIIRDKKTGQEWLLANELVSMSDNTYKKEGSNQPDFNVLLKCGDDEE